MKRKSKLPTEWQAYTNRKRKRSRSIPAWAYAAAGLGLGSMIGAGIIIMWPSNGEALAPARLDSVNGMATQRTFTICHTGGGRNCVVDGDTLWIDGTKIRVADIDAPETHPPRCDREADLGNRATRRLQELVNEGPFDTQPIGDRDQDRYGRRLRRLMRGGVSLGEVLVSEGLARPYGIGRLPWC